MTGLTGHSWLIQGAAHPGEVRAFCAASAV